MLACQRLRGHSFWQMKAWPCKGLVASDSDFEIDRFYMVGRPILFRLWWKLGGGWVGGWVRLPLVSPSGLLDGQLGHRQCFRVFGQSLRAPFGTHLGKESEGPLVALVCSELLERDEWT